MASSAPAATAASHELLLAHRAMDEAAAACSRAWALSQEPAAGAPAAQRALDQAERDLEVARRRLALAREALASQGPDAPAKSWGAH